MFEKLISMLSYREKVALKRLWTALSSLPLKIANPKSFIATLVIVAELISMLIFSTPVTPYGQQINLDEWQLTWSDEFDGDTLDTTKWSTHLGGVVRRGGYWSSDQLSVSDGTLKIRTEYLENGSLGAGWYSSAIETKELFEQKYGYFECRCICPPAMGLWAAFWMLGDGMFTTPTGSSANGNEIDMFESGNYGNSNPFKWDMVNQAAGYDGYSKNSHGIVLGNYKGKNIYTEYNTFALEWNENEIIFYINGVETDRLTDEWVPQVEQYLLLSVEVAGTDGETGVGGDGVPFVEDNKNIANNDPSIFPVDFIVDYVRVYQRKAAA